jgi:hypothetical protein
MASLALGHQEAAVKIWLIYERTSIAKQKVIQGNVQGEELTAES